MSLDSGLTIATGGLANVSRQLGVVSQNVSNANTAGYTREVGQQTALSSGGEGMGVRSAPALRSVDTFLQDEAWQQDGVVAGITTRAQALACVDAAHGTPGQGDDLAGLAGSLRDSFTSLSADPSSTAQQGAVVTAASAFAGGINRVADAVTTQRQAAQDSVSDEIGQLNTSLADIGTLSRQIMTQSNAGQGTAALEDQRDTAMQTVATLCGASFLRQADGGVQVLLPSGTTLPTDGTKLQIDAASLSPQVAAPAVTLGGQDVTTQFAGGQIGANLALRDTELPTFQAELDEFAHDTAARFNAAGLNLFTDGSSPVAAASTTPPVQAGYLGLANRIAVNPAVAANVALVRDGTGGATAGASGGTIVSAVLNGAFGPASATTAPAPNTQGLGLSGRLAIPFTAPQSLATFAASVVSVQTGASSDAAAQLSDAQATQATLNDKVAAVSGVSVDTEMSTMIGLQNSYAANARIITTTEQMWTTLLAMSTGT